MCRQHRQWNFRSLLALVGIRDRDDIFKSLELDKSEWVENICKGETSIKEFLASIDESIKESNRC